MKASKTITIDVMELLDGKHPAVVVRKLVEPQKGKIAVGQIVALNASGKVLPYVKGDETAGTAYGVATTPADTATGKDTGVNVLIHGTCKKSGITVVSGAAPVQADIDALFALGVYPLD